MTMRHKGKGAPRNEPINRCIYCGFTSSNPADLSKEHILPKGLGGADTLLKASCSKCASITSEVERICIRGSFWTLRSFEGHRGGLKLPDSDKYGIFPIFEPPSILKGQGGELNETFKLYLLTGTVEGETPPDAEVRASTFTVSPITFCQFISKVALGFCVRRFGVDGFISLVNPIIKGEVTHLPEVWRYVGGWPVPVSSKQPHYVGIHSVRIGDALYVGVTLRLFANYGLPTYHVIVGTIDEEMASKLGSSN